jgi:hypothetical protein
MYDKRHERQIQSKWVPHKQLTFWAQYQYVYFLAFPYIASVKDLFTLIDKTSEQLSSFSCVQNK